MTKSKENSIRNNESNIKTTTNTDQYHITPNFILVDKTILHTFAQFCHTFEEEWKQRHTCSPTIVHDKIHTCSGYHPIMIDNQTGLVIEEPVTVPPSRLS